MHAAEQTNPHQGKLPDSEQIDPSDVVLYLDVDWFVQRKARSSVQDICVSIFWRQNPDAFDSHLEEQLKAQRGHVISNTVYASGRICLL